MPDYYMNHDLTAYQAQVANDAAMHDSWTAQTEARQAQYDDAHAAWQEAHDEWEANGGISSETGEAYPEPVEPTPPDPLPEPTPTATVPAVFNGHQVTAVEEIETATGPALVVPERWVLSADNGKTSFAITQDELDAGYTLTSDAKEVNR